MTVTVGPIEKGIPVPPNVISPRGRFARSHRFPFQSMEPGDSFTIFGPRIDLFRLRNIAAVKANQYAAGKDKHFATRIVLADKLGWCVRVWRLR